MKSLIEIINALPLDGESAGGHEFLEKSKVIQAIDSWIEKEKRVTEIDKHCLNKIDNHEALEEDELDYLICNHEIERREGEIQRWQRETYSIVQLDDRFFSIFWMHGSPTNTFSGQPVEVKPITYTKTIEIKEWVKKND